MKKNSLNKSTISTSKLISQIVTRMTLIISLTYVLMPAVGLAQTLSFDAATFYQMGQRMETNIRIGDFNGDLVPDIASADSYVGRIFIRLGNGDGTFGSATSFAAFGVIRALAIGDLDGDEKLDLVTANNIGNRVYVLLGNGDGTFGSATSFIVGYRPNDVEIGDINGDFIADIVSVNYGSTDISILIGVGDGTFGAQTTIALSYQPYRVEIADLDDDGNGDLVVSSYYSSTNQIFLGSGGGAFGSPTTFVTGTNPGDVVIANLNNDSIPDIALPNVGSDDASILIGVGDGTFGAPTNINFGMLSSLEFGDLDCDGKLDMVATGGGEVNVLLGFGDGTFGASTNFVQTGGVSAISDFDGDGKLDLALAENWFFPNPRNIAGVWILLNATDTPPKCNFDHFLSYDVKTTKKTPKFEEREIFLKDQFLEGLFRVEKPEELLNPADKNGEGISDFDSHLLSYKVKERGDLGHFRLAGILVENQFGSLIVDVEEPDRLLVPASKSLSELLSPPDPSAHNVDHFLCYKIQDDDDDDDHGHDSKDSSESRDEDSEEKDNHPTIQVLVQDQFDNAPRLFDVKQPKRLCNPVDKNGEGIKNPDNHLLCYKVKPAKGERKHEKIKGIFVNDPFGPNQVDTKKEKELCVPSTKTLPPLG